jgi:hypothetical protein
MRFIQQQWESYRDLVLGPSGAGGIQQIECRRAFFGGAAAMLNALMKDLTPGEDPQPEDFAKLAAIDAELQQFAKDVKERKA